MRGSWRHQTTEREQWLLKTKNVSIATTTCVTTRYNTLQLCLFVGSAGLQISTISCRCTAGSLQGEHDSKVHLHLQHVQDIQHIASTLISLHLITPNCTLGTNVYKAKGIHTVVEASNGGRNSAWLVNVDPPYINLT